ncbi:MAG: cyclopropane-fatty-acyl-phospholipid synthase family protein [Planctomycetaceae bacterium]
MFAPLNLGIELVERGLVPDAITRGFIRRMCADRLRDPTQTTGFDRDVARHQFLLSLRSGPIAPVPEKANEQHYELPAEFFALMLGPHRKYSCCCFEGDRATLEQAEASALKLTCERAELDNGQDILELGCGWGALSLWMAEHFPASRITAVSNSAPQGAFILSQARARNFVNLSVITADMNEFTPPHNRYDRVVSVEMFEHMRNYEELLRRISSWLNPQGKLFVHHFCHREFNYPYETDGAGNWMGRYFFTGGMMPCADLLNCFDHHLTVKRQWSWNGRHYQRTADAWLANLDGRRDEALRILSTAYGPRQAVRWYHRWRMFLLAVSELFGYAVGNEWFVVHRLLEPVAVTQSLGIRSCPLSG